MVPGKFYYFLICVVKDCSLPLLQAFVVKCRVYCISLCLTTLLLHTPLTYYVVCVCFSCSFIHTSTLHPLFAQHHLCYVNVCYVHI